jgi:hypothetical protein
MDATEMIPDTALATEVRSMRERCRVKLPNVRHWSTHNPGPVKIDSETEWTLDLVQPGQCYPWEIFELAHQDYRMAVAEKDAWAQRARVIRKELEELVHEHLAELLAEEIITPSHLSLQWRWKSRGDELEAKISLDHPSSPRDTSEMLRLESPMTKLADWLMTQRPQLVEEHRTLMDKIERCRL